MDIHIHPVLLQQPVAATCKDVDPQANPGQQFSCDESSGWQYDPRNGNVTSLAQEACCVVGLNCELAYN